MVKILELYVNNFVLYLKSKGTKDNKEFAPINQFLSPFLRSLSFLCV